MEPFSMERAMQPEMLNSFSVVSYLTGELATFVDSFRCEVTPGCPHRAHLTLLPPRPLDISTAAAADECARILETFHPFDVQITGVSLFESTEVIKLTVGQGVAELRTLHDVLNTGSLEHAENYDYVPHVTLSMKTPGRTAECFELAKQRWTRFSKPMWLRVDRLTLVQQRADETWSDLVELPIGPSLVYASARR